MRSLLLMKLLGRRLREEHELILAERDELRAQAQLAEDLLAERDRLSARAEELQLRWGQLHEENVELHCRLIVATRKHKKDLQVLAQHTTTIGLLTQACAHARAAGHDEDGLELVDHLLHHQGTQ